MFKGVQATGEGFGTCHECWVHACPQHGDRTRQFFRCADCIAAGGVDSALVEPVEGSALELRAEAPRLSALSAEMRERFDPRQVAASLRWVHRRVREKKVLLPTTERGPGLESEEGAATALGFSYGEVDPATAARELWLRASMVEERVRGLALEADVGEEALGEEALWEGAGEVAAASLAIAYAARGAEGPEMSPLKLRGGALLPPQVLVLGHAYSVTVPPSLATASSS